MCLPRDPLCLTLAAQPNNRRQRSGSSLSTENSWRPRTLIKTARFRCKNSRPISSVPFSSQPTHPRSLWKVRVLSKAESPSCAPQAKRVPRGHQGAWGTAEVHDHSGPGSGGASGGRSRAERGRFLNSRRITSSPKRAASVWSTMASGDSAKGSP